MILITNLGRCLSHVSHCLMPLKKFYKNFTEQLPSNSVSAQIFLMLWTLNAGAASLCSAFWIHALRACIWKHNILQFIYKSFKAISLFQSSYSNQQPPLPLLIGGMRCSAKQSLVLVMIFASFSDSFKYFHTADMFAAFVRASIWSCHVIVRYILFGLFTYSIRKSFFFAIFGQTISVAEHSVHP